jgi:hypothetical protein
MSVRTRAASITASGHGSSPTTSSRRGREASNSRRPALRNQILSTVRTSWGMPYVQLRRRLSLSLSVRSISRPSAIVDPLSPTSAAPSSCEDLALHKSMCRRSTSSISMRIAFPVARRSALPFAARPVPHARSCSSLDSSRRSLKAPQCTTTASCRPRVQTKLIQLVPPFLDAEEPVMRSEAARASPEPPRKRRRLRTFEGVSVP